MNIKTNKWFRNLAGVFAMTGFLVCMLNFDMLANTPQGCILWVIEVFAVTLSMGYLGLELELWINRKTFQAIGRKSILLGLIASIVIGAFLGTAGQILYSLELREYTENEIIKGTTTQANIALMVDYSGSMDLVLPEYLEATNKLIDDIDERNSLQFAAFSCIDIDKDKDATDMQPMTPQNKTATKNFINNISYLYGYGTNFDIAIDFAVASLVKNQADDTRSVIIILTDCEGTASQYSLDSCKQNNCELYVLTLNNGNSATNQLQQVADKYFQITTNPDGTINVSDVTKALEEAVNGNTTVTVTKKRLALSENIIGGFGDITVARVIITILFFGLLTTVAGLIYYGFESIRNILINFAFGAVAGILTLIFMPTGIVFLLCAGLGSFNKYTVTEESSDV